jgi:hypothetical protein
MNPTESKADRDGPTPLDRPFSHSTAGQSLIHAALLAILLVAAFPGFFLRGERIAPGDLLFQSRPWEFYAPPDFERPVNRLMPDVVTAFVPYYALTRMALDEGEWPLWNHLEYGGMPLLANAQSAVFYPPRLLHALLELHLATSFYILLKLWLCGMTAFLCARGLNLSLAASRFFSIAWMLGGYNLLWSYWSLPDVAAWLPILFLGAEWVIEARYRRGIFAMALGGALMLLAGHPETAFIMAAGVGQYFFLRLLLEQRWGLALLRPLAAATAAWTLALFFCAAQLLPFIEYLAVSSTLYDRGATGLAPPLSPGAVVSFFVPRFYGTSADDNYWGTHGLFSNTYMMMYPGIAVWLGVVFLAARGKFPAGHGLKVVCLLIVSLFAILLAFNAPTIDRINELPVINSMIKYYHIAFAVFALPLAGAIGIDHWFSRPRKLWDLIPAVLTFAGIGVMVLSVFRFFLGIMRSEGVERYVLAEVSIAAALLIACLTLAALYRYMNRPALLLNLLVLVLICDLLVTGRGTRPTLAREYLYPDTELTQFLQGLEQPARVALGDGAIASGLMVPYGIEDWLGYDGLYPRRMTRFQIELDRDVWGPVEPTRSVEYVLNDPRYPPIFPLDEHPEYFERVTTLDSLEVYRNKRAFHRAWLVPEVQIVPDLDEMFDIMRDPQFDPARVALLEEPLPRPLASTGVELDSTERAAVTKRTSTHVAVDVETLTERVLVLSDAYYPGWQARIDGQRAEVFPTYSVYRGVLVPQGKHTVEFDCRPWTFALGLALTAATCLFTLAFALAALRKQKRRACAKSVQVRV